MASEQEASAWYEWATYSWITPLLTTGSDRFATGAALEAGDMFRLPSHEEPAFTSKRLHDSWQEEAALGHEQRSLVRALWRAFRVPILLSGVFRFLSDFGNFATVMMLRQFIVWLDRSADAADYHEWEGPLWAVGIVATNVLAAHAQVAEKHYAFTGVQQMITGLSCMVYDAAFQFRHDHGRSGHLLTAHSTDTQKMFELALFMHGVWASPLLVVAAAVALSVFMGWAGLATVGVALLFMPLMLFLISRVFGLRVAQLKKLDRRVQKINEALQGIRVCKFMGWEPNFLQVIDDARGEEVGVLRWMYFFRSAAGGTINISHQVIIFALFGFAYAIDGSSVITAENVFPALGMVNLIRVPLVFIPLSFAKLIETKISLARIQGILEEDGHVDYVRRGQETSTEPTAAPSADPSVALRLENVTVLGDGGAVLAPSLSLGVERGSLTMVVGATASGKSTLVNAMIGEADVARGASGFAEHRGTVAYVPQDAWIMNASLRENVLCGRPYDAAAYLAAVNACQLAQDLELLPASDETAIGERGINLSGGQKQRIALARAVYSARDIVVMDDPLSAVDPHVCQAIFHGCVGAALRGRTRVLVTHQVQFLPFADRIVVMDGCAVTFNGTYADFLASGIDPTAFTESAESPKARAAHSKVAHTAMSRDAKKRLAAEAEAAAKLTHRTAIPAANSKADPLEKAGEVEQVGEQGGLASKEDQAIGDVPWGTYLWYTHLGGAGLAFLVVFFSLVACAGSVMAALLLAWWAGGDSRTAGWDGRDFLLWLGVSTAVYVAFIVLRQGAHIAFLGRAAQNIHHEMTASVLRAPVSFFDTTPLGRIVNRFTKDMEGVDTKIPDTTSSLLNQFFPLLVALVVVCVSFVYMTVVYPVIAVLFYVLYRYYIKTLRGLRRLQGIARSPMIAALAETLGGLGSIRAYGLQGSMIAEHCRRVQAAFVPVYCVRLTQNWVVIRTSVMGASLVALICLLSVLAKVLENSSWLVGFTPAVAALALTQTVASTQGIMMLSRFMAEFESEMSSTERIKEYSDAIPQERSVAAGPDDGSDNDEEAAPLPPSWPQDGALVFDDAQLRYRPGLPLVLKGVSLRIKSGAKVGIVGRTGSGKSTLMLALFRLVELASGSITFAGHDVAAVPLKALRQQITIIPQDPLLFAGTVRSNLDPFGARGDDEVWAAVTRVGLRPRLEEAGGGQEGDPSGLDAVVAEKGSNFSVGQRQLLCLARALLKRSKVLLLDEATASVDAEVDALIQRTIRAEFSECTVLTIAHRLATVTDADRILVLGDGKVIEYAAPAALLRGEAGNGAFRGMAEQLGPAQFKALLAIATKSPSP